MSFASSCKPIGSVRIYNEDRAYNSGAVEVDIR
jgi:hypothetical protein